MSKFQFGSIMPQSRPVAFQYKPLGLESFAAPLAAKQKAFDATYDAVDKAKFDIKGINAEDNRRAAELSKELEGYKNTLLTKLDESGNYREIARRLRGLNRTYNEDPEIMGIRQTRKATEKAIKKEKKRVDKGEITQKDFDEWQAYTLGNYSGYNYDRETGAHNSIDLSPRGENLEKEIFELADKLTKAAPKQKSEDYVSAIQSGLINAGYGELGEDKLLKITKVWKDKNQVQREVLDFMRQSERFTDYIDEDAKYEFYSNVQKNPNFINAGVDSLETLYDESIGQLDQVINSNQDPSIINKAKEEKANLEKAKSAFLENKELAANQGYYYGFAENAYKQHAQATYLNDLIGASSDIYDLLETGMNIKGLGDGSSGSAKEELENIDKFKVITHALTDKKTTTPWIPGSAVSATSSQEEFSKGGAEGQEELYNDFKTVLKGNISKAEDDLMEKWKSEYGDPHGLDKQIKELRDNLGTYPEQSQLDKLKELEDKRRLANISGMDQNDFSIVEGLYRDAQNAHSLYYAADTKWNGLIKTKEAELAKILSDNPDISTLSLEEQKKINSDITSLRSEINLVKRNKQNTFGEMNLMINEEMQKEGNEWMQKAFDKGGYDEVYKQAYEISLSNLENFQYTPKWLKEGGVYEYSPSKEEIDAEVQKFLKNPNVGPPEGIPYETWLGQVRYNKTADLIKNHKETQAKNAALLERSPDYNAKMIGVKDKIIEAAMIQDEYGDNMLPTIENGGIIKDEKTGRLMFKDPKLKEFEYTLAHESYSNAIPDVIDAWNKKRMIGESAIATTLRVNKGSNAITDNLLQEDIDAIKEFGSGNPGSARQVSFDAGTGKVKNINYSLYNDAWNINLYNANPVLVGVSMQDGHQHKIYMYNRKSSVGKGAIESIIAKNKYGGDTSENRDKVTDQDIADYETQNPSQLYLSLEGNSGDFVEAAAKNLADLGTKAINANDDYALRVMLDSYAAVDIVSNNERRQDYGEKSTTLIRALEQKDPNMFVQEEPAVLNYLADGTAEGYSVRYRYDPNRDQMVADVSLLRFDKNGNIIQNEDGSQSTPVTTHILSSINSQALRGIDILYGVGDKRDRVNNIVNNRPFVPAFVNRNLANKLYNN